MSQQRTFPIQHTIFLHHAGLKISYAEDFAGTYLVVEDLNPEKKIMFYMSPAEMLAFGFRCIWRSFWR